MAGRGAEGPGRRCALVRIVAPPDGKGFDLYADVRSQVYGGVPGEHASTTAAIQATKGEVLLWEGKPIDALFHSTSGGTTIDAAEGFGKPVPTWSRSTIPTARSRPCIAGGPSRCPRRIRSEGPEVALAGDRAQARPRAVSGRVTSVEAVRRSLGDRDGRRARSASGAPVDLDHAARDALPVRVPAGRPSTARPLTLVGKAQGSQGPVLEQRVDGRLDALVGRARAPRPRSACSRRRVARISAGTLTGPTLKVPVAPLVTLRADGPAELIGSRQAARSRGGRSSCRSNARWTTGRRLARRRPAPTGAFTLPLGRAGRLPARVAPVPGFAEGLSAPIELR